MLRAAILTTAKGAARRPAIVRPRRIGLAPKGHQKVWKGWRNHKTGFQL